MGENYPEREPMGYYSRPLWQIPGPIYLEEDYDEETAMKPETVYRIPGIGDPVSEVKDLKVDLALVDRQNYQLRARVIVMNYFNDNVEKSDKVTIGLEDVYVVWFCKTLGNWKALLSTTVSDGMYYEVTYNGEGKVTYFDAYKKFRHLEIPDEV